MFYNRFVFLKSTVRLSGSTTMSFPFSHLLLNINMLHAAASCKRKMQPADCNQLLEQTTFGDNFYG